MNNKNGYRLRLTGKNFEGNEYVVTLGPWKSKEAAQRWSDLFTDTRVGEQILEKFGVETLGVAYWSAP